jgi:microcystin-dependent protein
MEPFIGQILLFGGNFAPVGWAFCDGQLLSIAQNSALFSLLGTTYGGDGRTTFALPDLRGRVPVGIGGGPGLSPKSLGEKGGAQSGTVTGTAQIILQPANLPSHTHAVTGEVKVAVADQVGNFASAAMGNPLGKTAMEITTSNDVEMYVGGKTKPSFNEGNKLGGISHNLTTAAAGTGTPLSAPVTGDVAIMPPYTALNYIIATEGIYPSRP